MALTIHWKDCGYSRRQILSVANKLQKRLKELRKIVDESNYQNDAASLILPTDYRHAAAARVYAQQCRNAALLVVVGIGGSNLGTVAVQDAALGKYYNLSAKTEVLYSDTLDPDSMHHILDRTMFYLKQGQKVVINVITKSGTTAETVANMQVLLNAVGKHKNAFVVITTDSGSRLEAVARKKLLHTLPIPVKVGGRFSVLSSVGLFPLAVMGVNIERLIEGAHIMLQHCLRKDIHSNPALLLASIAYLHHKKRPIQDTFVFSNDLIGYAAWYRQLLAESAGKGDVGIRPTVSVGSTDLHSVGQYDIAGPDLTYYRFINVKRRKHSVTVPSSRDFNALVPHLAGKSYARIMDAILKGTQTAFRKRKRPFVEVEMSNLDEESIGGLLQVDMVTTFLLCHLLNVDPFNQPAVEEYKSATRKLLR